jgi:hypothetical protein
MFVPCWLGRLVAVSTAVIAWLAPATGRAAAEPAVLPAQFAISSEPAWVDPVPADFQAVPDAREAISDGVQHLIVDNQVCLGATNATYYHYAFRFLNEAGVREWSSIQIACDPSYQSVQFHRLRLWRGGQIIDCLDMKAFRALQRESNLEWKLLDGRLTLLALLEDVRVGDVLEYAYTLTGDNPIFEGRYGGSHLLGWSLSVLRHRLRVLAPAERTLFRRISGAAAPEPVERLAGGTREWLWDQTNTAPIQVESGLPGWYKPMPEVAFSEYASWADVARWAAACYATTGSLDSALGPRISDWLQRPAAEDRAVAALVFVQDEIRYFGLELGVGSHRPNPPELVLQRRFGDCKDKAVLLCAILRALGVDAQPALVNVFACRYTADELPSPSAFNHVIVVARIDGAAVWMDPTRANQRGRLRDRYLPPYGVALVIADGTTGLQPVEPADAGESRTEIHECFDLRNAEAPADLTVRSVFRGRDAENSRAGFSNSSRADLERHYLNYYAQRYSGVRSDGAVSVEDAAASNLVTISERYTISAVWSPDRTQTNRQVATFGAQELRTFVEQPTTVLRTMPLGLPYPVDTCQTIEILLSKDFRCEPEQVVYRDPYLHFEFTSAHTNRVITLTYRLRTLADAVPVSAMTEHLELRRKIGHSLEYSLTEGPPAQAEDGGFVLNRAMVAVTALWCGLLTLAGIRGYRYRPAPAPVPVSERGTPMLSPRGIGGWLILPCIGLVAGAFTILASLAQLSTCFDATVWRALTTPGAPNYHALWRPTFLIELLGNTFLFALLTLAGMLLIRRRASFPRSMIALYAAQLVLVLVDSALCRQIPAVIAQTQQADAEKEVMRAIIAACVWIPYFLNSRRVRNTFRN